MSNELSEKELSNLLSQLSSQGVYFSEKIEITASGTNGLCFIGPKNVLKLYGNADNSFVGNAPKDSADFFHQSTDALQAITKAKTSFDSVGIAVPELVGAGLLPSPIDFKDKHIFAYQIMTRVPGELIEGNVSWWLPEKSSAVNALLKEVAKIGAKIHAATGFVVGEVDLNCGFGWTKEGALTREDRILLATHERIIKSHFLENPARLVWTHGDFGPQNILKSDNGSGVIDWDFRGRGVAEDDLWVLAFHPKHTAEFCATYNDMAGQKLVHEKLVLSYGMLQQMRNCHLFLQDENSIGKFGGQEACKLRFDWSKTRVANIAEQMHELTGDPVYAQAQERFSEIQYSAPTRPTKHPAAPQVREALRAES